MRDPTRPTYFLRDDHCTRCEQPFGGNRIVAHMVWDQAADGNCYGPDDLDDLEATRFIVKFQMVPVCDACVTDEERVRLDADVVCAGCDRPMRIERFHWSRRCRYICASRCEARARRRHRRAAMSARCEACKKTFTLKRADAKFCSNACRQQAYRRRATTASRPTPLHGHGSSVTAPADDGADDHKHPAVCVPHKWVFRRRSSLVRFEDGRTRRAGQRFHRTSPRSQTTPPLSGQMGLTGRAPTERTPNLNPTVLSLLPPWGRR